jgi:type IV secretion system protein VirB10
MVLEDVYSANGHTLLIRRGADAFGEQRQALLQGQARIAVLWDEIDDGPVRIMLDSPGTDSLGATGLPAYVDNHFWQRFDGALMVSLVGSFGQALSNRTVGGGSNQISIGGSGNEAQSVAEEVLRNSINIPPTAYTNQGQVTNIFVARHIDMRSVYKVVQQ